MRTFLSRVRNFDNFGQPVSVNYKGASAYKTLPGAIATLVIKIIVLVFALVSFLELIVYKNPNVSQVSLSDIAAPQSVTISINSLVLHLRCKN